MSGQHEHTTDRAEVQMLIVAYMMFHWLFDRVYRIYSKSGHGRWRHRISIGRQGTNLSVRETNLINERRDWVCEERDLGNGR